MAKKSRFFRGISTFLAGASLLGYLVKPVSAGVGEKSYSFGIPEYSLGSNLELIETNARISEEFGSKYFLSRSIEPSSDSKIKISGAMEQRDERGAYLSYDDFLARHGIEEYFGIGAKLRADFKKGPVKSKIVSGVNLEDRTFREDFDSSRVISGEGFNGARKRAVASTEFRASKEIGDYDLDFRGVVKNNLEEESLQTTGYFRGGVSNTTLIGEGKIKTLVEGKARLGDFESKRFLYFGLNAEYGNVSFGSRVGINLDRQTASGQVSFEVLF